MKDFLLEHLIKLLPSIVAVIIILVAGKIITKFTLKIMGKGLLKSKVDPTAHSFLLSLTKTVLQVLIVVSLLSAIGIPMASIIAVIGAAGLAIGLALQNSLSNVAGGFIILFAKPFKKGDFVEVSGQSGIVESISILYTKLATLDNRGVFIPNGQMSNATLVNFNEYATRRLDLTFSISYADDYKLAVKLIEDIIASHPMALRSPEPMVRMSAHSASSITIVSRVWVKTDDYWTLHFDMLEQVKASFDRNGISIPYNQLDVHVIEKK